MWYLPEPRSHDYGYDDDESGGSAPSCDWKFVLFLPLIVLLLVLVSIAPFLAMAAYFLNDVHSTLKRTVESGKLAYPFLVEAGAVGAIVLSLGRLSQWPNTLLQSSFFLILAIGFVLIFTVLPILAVGLHWIGEILSFSFMRPRSLKLVGLHIVLLGVVIATSVFSLNIGKSPVPLATKPTATAQAQSTQVPVLAPTSTAPVIPQRTFTILVDDFLPQPYQLRRLRPCRPRPLCHLRPCHQ